jgi:hypothetical protein
MAPLNSKNEKKKKKRPISSYKQIFLALDPCPEELMTPPLNGATCCSRGNSSVLNEKMDKGIISVFIYSTGTTYDKNKNSEKQKLKFLNHIGLYDIQP